MNENTKDKLLKFIDAMELLTSCVQRDTGAQAASEIVQACEDLKTALQKYETLP